MEQIEPEFIKQGYGYYDNEGLKIKKDAPKWAKDEYEEFMRELDSCIISE